MPIPPLERKLAAIFAADVVGYSRLMSRDEVGTHARLKAARTRIDALIAAHRGRIFNTAGDSVVADFASAVDAVACAVAVQEAIAAEDAGHAEEERMRFRIGVHIGDVIVEGADLLGDGVNIAARLQALAEPGAICVSGIVRDQVGSKLPVTFTDLGEQQVKNIPQPIRVYRAAGGGAAAPSGVMPPAPPDKPSIAVLPFQNMSGDPEQEYFADGVVEEIITALSKVRWFFVIARNSSFTYKGRAVNVKQVGRELGVRYVLEGSVRKGGTRVRITVQLVDAATGSHVWSERYDRELSDIFALQDEITERVVAAIEPQLYAAEHFRAQRNPPERLDAWECVVRALSAIGQGTRAGDAEAEALCRRAVALAPGYAQAHSLLAWVLMRRTMLSSDLKAALPEATAEVRTALGLAELDPWAHLTHGMVLFRMKRHGEAERAYRRALDCNPNSALAHAALGQTLAAQGAHEEAISSAEHALRLSPSDPRVGAQASHTIAFARFAAGRYADCVASIGETVERYPEYLPGHYVLVAAAAMLGDTALTADALAALLRVRPDFSLAWLDRNMPWIGEIAERLVEGWRRAGVPES